jgi:hypothetical protein
MSGAIHTTGADTVIGSSGKPIRLWAVNILSDSTAGQLVLRNGIVDTAAIYIREVGTASTGKTVVYGEEGILFPNGMFYDQDANILGLTVQFTEEK